MRRQAFSFLGQPATSRGMTDRRKKTAMIYERLVDDLEEISAVLQMSGNALVNAGLESLFKEMKSKKKPEVPAIVQLYRKATRRDLTAADKLVFGWLESHFPDWAAKTAEFRRLTVKIASESEDLDVKKIQSAADAAWKIVCEKERDGVLK